MGRKKKTDGPRLRGGSDSARANGLVGINLYVYPQDRERLTLAAEKVGAESARALATNLVLAGVRQILENPPE